MPAMPQLVDLLLHRTLATYGCDDGSADLVDEALRGGADLNQAIALPHEAAHEARPALQRLIQAWGTCRGVGLGSMEGFGEAWDHLISRGARVIGPSAWHDWVAPARLSEYIPRRPRNDVRAFLCTQLLEHGVPLTHRTAEGWSAADAALQSSISFEEACHIARELQELGSPVEARRHILGWVDWVYVDAACEHWSYWLGQFEQQLGPKGLTQGIALPMEGQPPASEAATSMWSPAGWLAHTLLSYVRHPIDQDPDALAPTSWASIDALWRRWDALGVDWQQPCVGAGGDGMTPLEVVAVAHRHGHLAHAPFLQSLHTRVHLCHHLPQPSTASSKSRL